MKNIPSVMKADGKSEQFDPSKLEKSLLAAGAKPEAVQKIIAHVQAELIEGITTSQIYKHAFFLLHKLQTPASYRYGMRQAVLALGPSGFPFEKYVAEILRSQGYSVETNQMVRGGCVEHEVDVVAWNEKKLIMCEAKFHNQRGMKCDLKVALYVKARFDDLLEATYTYGGHRRSVSENWLITNTGFTSTAIEYGMCKNMTMIGWSYPGRVSLQSMIEDGDLMPITCLTEIHSSELKSLLEQGIVLCKQIRNNVSLLVDAGLPSERAKMLVDEVNNI